VDCRGVRSLRDAVGLGLFAIAASFVGGVIALVGLIRLVIHASRTQN